MLRLIVAAIQISLTQTDFAESLGGDVRCSKEGVGCRESLEGKQMNSTQGCRSRELIVKCGVSCFNC